MMEVNLTKFICIIHNILWKLLVHKVETGKKFFPKHFPALLCSSTPTTHTDLGNYQGNHETGNKDKVGNIIVFSVKEIILSNESSL